MKHHCQLRLTVSAERVDALTGDADHQLTLSEWCGGPRIYRFAPEGGFPLPTWIHVSRARLARRIQEFKL